MHRFIRSVANCDIMTSLAEGQQPGGLNETWQLRLTDLCPSGPLDDIKLLR
jgi:hypothetical protein